MRTFFSKIPFRLSLPLVGLALAVVTIGLIVVSRPPVRSVESVVPAETREAQLSRLDSRFATRKEGDKTYILTGENRARRYSTIEIQNGIVTAVTVDDPNQFQFPRLQGYQSAYGQADSILYGPWEESGFRSYLYLKEGLIVIGHERTGEVIEVWRIAKGLTPEQFLQGFGDRFSTASRRESRF